MIIAAKGKFLITHEIFLGNRKLTTKSIELCKNINNQQLTIAKINSAGNLESITDRLISYIDTEEDLVDVKKLLKVLYSIYETDEVELK